MRLTWLFRFCSSANLSCSSVSPQLSGSLLCLAFFLLAPFSSSCSLLEPSIVPVILVRLLLVNLSSCSLSLSFLLPHKFVCSYTIWQFAAISCSSSSVIVSISCSSKTSLGIRHLSYSDLLLFPAPFLLSILTASPICLLRAVLTLCACFNLCFHNCQAQPQLQLNFG